MFTSYRSWFYRLGYSKKGYTDGEIGVAWIQHFDKQTKDKANGRYRLLVVDGHNSHYTRGFLEYARTHRIRVLCYPSHSTHVYQGLDVVIFAVLKRYWSEERDKFERETKTKVSKSNFLKVYAAAHVRAFTEDNIKAAFRKTGLVPFDPDVITPAMMAPSLETSSRGVMPLASQQTSPTRAISQLLLEHVARKRKADDINGNNTTPPGSPLRQRTANGPRSPARTPHPSRGVIETPSPFLRHSTVVPTTPLSIRRTLFAIQSSSASFLVSPSPMQSTSQLPPLLTSVISPSRSKYAHLLHDLPRTYREEQLMDALHEAEKRIDTLKENNRVLQAQTVLQGLYVGGVRSELQAQEDKKGKGRSKKLNADGCPKLMDMDEFYVRVVEDDERRKLEAEEKARKRAIREEATELRKKWEEEEEARKVRNSRAIAAWQTAVKEWEIERSRAKEARQRPNWTKPVKPKTEPPKPKTWTKKGSAQATAIRDADEGETDAGEDDDDDDEDA